MADAPGQGYYQQGWNPHKYDQSGASGHGSYRDGAGPSQMSHQQPSNQYQDPYPYKAQAYYPSTSNAHHQQRHSQAKHCNGSRQPIVDASLLAANVASRCRPSQRLKEIRSPLASKSSQSSSKLVCVRRQFSCIVEFRTGVPQLAL